MKMEKAAEVLIILFFAAVAIVGLSGADHYGLPVSAMDMQDTAVFAPITAVRENHQPHEFKVLWQNYTWLVFMAGMWALYGFCRETGVGRFFSCMGVLAMLFCPRFCAEGHYSRDMVLLSLLLGVLWLGVRFAKKPTVIRGLWFAAAGALAVNASLAAGLLWLGMLACAIIALTAGKGWNRRTAAGVVCAVLAAAALLVILSPAAPAMPEARAILFRGTAYDPAVEAMPWYAPLWTLILTLPLFAFPLIGFGQIGACWRIRAKQKSFLGDGASLALIAAALCWLLPLLAGIFRPQIHHIWETKCFLYAGLAVMMARGVMEIYRFGRHFGGDCGMHLVIMAGLLLFFGWTARDIDRNHPYEYAYFNRLGHNIAVRQMELDGENASAFNALQTLVSTVEEAEPLTVSAVDELSLKGLESAWEMLPPAQKARIALVPAEEAEYLYTNTTYLRITRGRVPRGYQKLFDLKSYDLIISSVYEKR